MDWYNYLEIPTYLPTGYKYLYVDVKEKWGEALFRVEEIQADCMVVGHDEKNDSYVLIECDIAESDKQKFIEAMDHLVRKMAFNGHSDYLQACHRIFGFEDAR